VADAAGWRPIYGRTWSTSSPMDMKWELTDHRRSPEPKIKHSLAILRRIDWMGDRLFDGK
jgi:hypothetical protein